MHIEVCSLIVFANALSLIRLFNIIWQMTWIKAGDTIILLSEGRALLRHFVLVRSTELPESNKRGVASTQVA